MKKLAVLLALLFFANIGKILADDLFPYSYSQNSVIENGKIFFNDSATDSKLYFIIKSSWAEDNETIFIQNSLYSDNKKTAILNSTNILAAIAGTNRLLFASKKDESFYISIADENFKILSEIQIKETPTDYMNGSHFYKSGENYFLQIGSFVYLVKTSQSNSLKAALIASDIYQARSIDNYDGKLPDFVYASGNNDVGLLRLVYTKTGEIYNIKTALAEDTKIEQFGKYLFIIGSYKKQNVSLVQIIDLETRTILSNNWINARGSFCSVSAKEPRLLYLNFEKNAYSLNSIYFNQLDRQEFKMSVDLPKELVEPLCVKSKGDEIFIVFKNGLLVTDSKLNIISLDFIPIGENFESTPEIKFDGKILALIGNNSTLLLQEKYNSFWRVNYFLNYFGRYIVIIIISLIALYFLRAYKNQKRTFEALLDLPSSGFFFLLDNSARLVKANALAKDLLHLTDNIPLKRSFKYYCKNEASAVLLNTLETFYNTKQAFSGKISIIEDGVETEWLAYITPIINIAGLFRGAVFTGIDITEQLERKRLTNWAQLAHDMQTNLSTIRLNAEHLEVEGNASDASRRKKIIHQVHILMQRIRDILSVGRNDGIDLQNHYSTDICAEARSEFDEALFPNVEFKLDVEIYQINCDKSKMVRALRNSIENSLKALKGAKGTITIKSYKDAKNGYFIIKDDGPGMTSEVKSKFLTPFFTTASSGAGHGIGTMIMQRAIEMHGGKISVDSEPGKGCEIRFSIPIYRKSTK